VGGDISFGVQALQDATVRPFAEHCTAQQLAWLQSHLARSAGSAASAQLLLNFLAAGSASGYPYTPEFYGCLAAVNPVIRPICCMEITLGLFSVLQHREQRHERDKQTQKHTHTHTHKDKNTQREMGGGEEAVLLDV
jgi:hypothetical protein